ncbi:MAG: hypothetical protein KC506_00890 [Nanoarchaeota archaeon]|nr:hypothetical protein [Nanoarchaeota archaeon]
MRRLSFILYILGIVFLMVLFLQPGREVESLDGLIVNEQVVVSGRVVSEREIYLGTKLLELDNGVEAVCECSDSFEGKDVRIEGFVSEYNGKNQVSVERIFVLE